MTILVTGANGQLGSELRIVSRDSRDRYIYGYQSSRRTRDYIS